MDNMFNNHNNQYNNQNTNTHPNPNSINYSTNNHTNNNYNSTNDFYSNILTSIDIIMRDLYNIKRSHYLGRNDLNYINQSIDYNIREINNIKTYIENNQKINNSNFITYNTRLNYAFKKINNLEKQLGYKKHKTYNSYIPNIYSSNNKPDITPMPTTSTASNIKITPINHNKNDISNDTQIIKINDPSTMSFFPLFSMMGGSSKKNTTNDLIDSEDEYDDSINVYDITDNKYPDADSDIVK